MSIPEHWEAKARSNRRLVTVVTLAVCAVLFVLMGLLGLKAVKAPLGPRSGAATECPAEDIVRIDSVSRDDVTVSVYNAGGPQGYANRTLDHLEHAGFHPGEVGNAPAGVRKDSTVVYTTSKDDTAAKLVAAFLGGAPVEVVSDEYGPGVDVFVGRKKHVYDTKAPRQLKLADPIVRCDRG